MNKKAFNVAFAFLIVVALFNLQLVALPSDDPYENAGKINLDLAKEIRNDYTMEKIRAQAFVDSRSGLKVFRDAKRKRLLPLSVIEAADKELLERENSLHSKAGMDKSAMNAQETMANQGGTVEEEAISEATKKPQFTSEEETIPISDDIFAKLLEENLLGNERDNAPITSEKVPKTQMGVLYDDTDILI